jgi:hypothetical protein
MKNKVFLAVALVVALCVVGFTQSQPKPQQWEYKYTANFKDLDKLGADGWELVAVEGNGAASTYYLKRPK